MQTDSTRSTDQTDQTDQTVGRDRSDRPNIVVLYADDLGWGDLGCFGAEYETPALDGLCASGVKLSQWYSNSPVCSPSRASLLTGKYPAHAGVEAILGGTRRTPGLPQQATLASELRRRGYRTGLFGKWHLGASDEYSPSQYGFEETFGIRAGCVDYYSHIFYWGNHNPIHDLWDDDEEVWLNGEYLTTVIGDRAADFIGRHAGEPFFCFVPFNAPHYPMHAPAEYMDRFAHLPEGRQEMAAMVGAMDDAVATILAALAEHGLAENTLVFFSSDNGPSAESRNWLDGEEISYDGGWAGGLRGTKGSVFEGGVREPSIISWPARLPAGTEFDSVGMMMDVLPTVLHAVDGTPADTDAIDGASLMEPLTAAGAPGAGGPDRSVYWTYEGQWAVRRGDLKLVRDAREGMDPPAAVVQALYDLATDPAETTDISAQRSDQLAALTEELSIFQAKNRAWVDAETPAR
ncbi:sulfatase-like hydrolase/transferase [Ruania alkalisoli]|uniref:Sulfatase-like hydrolase/transferase n=1 Tax=Ruania alkalisoli TaxID=2779775 RepID=A0A7M1SXI6_9MICO|nr:sulfatase-like hydrolase/transferase [Ruania alkalisoli]QOR72290.1 sulfatase-like hydrolase/transferase [Ruania alkalisoli]